MTLQITSRSIRDTAKLAAQLAANLRGGEIIELKSDLGGGKTTFTKALVKALGSTDHVSSPSFALSKEYTAKGLTIVHFDFYRLDNAIYVADALAEAMQGDKIICVIEWGDIIVDILPEDRIVVAIQRVPHDEMSRNINITAPAQYVSGLSL